MGIGLHKIIKLGQGTRLNLSKSGVSASVGVKGATINFGDRGARGTVGIPGTGISYTEQIAPGGRLMTPVPEFRPPRSTPAVLVWLVVLVVSPAVLSKLMG